MLHIYLGVWFKKKMKEKERRGNEEINKKMYNIILNQTNNIEIYLFIIFIPISLFQSSPYIFLKPNMHYKNVFLYMALSFLPHLQLSHTSLANLKISTCYRIFENLI